MFYKLNLLLKQRVHPYLLLGSSLVLITLLTALAGMMHYQYELSHDSKLVATTNARVLGKTSIHDLPSSAPAAAAGNTASAGSTSGVTTSTTSHTATKKAAAAGTNTQAPGQQPATHSTASPAPAVVKASLSINGYFKGTVTLPSTANQCDVLSEALKEGLISNLDMRYSSQYKTNAVYVISGIGDSSAIWWTYKVNGKSPPYGCSGTAVHNGDSVDWQYVKK